MKTVNLEGLNDEQLELVERFVDVLRRARDRQAVARDLQRLLARRGRACADVSDDEVDRLAAEAVAYARGGA